MVFFLQGMTPGFWVPGLTNILIVRSKQVTAETLKAVDQLTLILRADVDDILC